MPESTNCECTEHDIMLTKFNQWLRFNGASYPHLDISSSGNSGSGLFLRFRNDEGATDLTIPIHAPASLATIPRNLLISANSIRSVEDANLIVAFSRLPQEKTLDERLRIIMYLLFAMKNVLKTDHDGYASILPKHNDLSSLSLWSGEEKALLLGTPLDTALSAKMKVLEKEYSQIIKPFFDEVYGMDVTLDDFVYADAIFWSRVLSFKGLLPQPPSSTISESSNSPFQIVDTPELHMIPLIDFCNHADEPNVRWELCSDNVELRTYGNVDLSFNKSEHVAELCISYGSKSNSEMLFTYGFCLNEVDEREIFNFNAPLDLMDDSAEQTTIRISLARKLLLKQFVNINYPNLCDSIEKTLDSILEQRCFALLILCVLDFDQVNNFCEQYHEASNISVEKFLSDVKSMCSMSLLQLRCVMVLKDALSEHLSLLEMTNPNEGTMKNYRPHILESAVTYRKGVHHLLSKVVDSLETCQGILAEHPELVKYFE